MQDNIWIGDVQVPTVVDDGVRYYPISYLSSKILLRETFLSPKKKKLYADQIKKFIITFSESNIQEANCIEEELLKQLLVNTQVGRLTVEQKKSQNQLHKHLGIELLNEREIIIDKMTLELLKEHDYYTEDVIKEDIKRNKHDEYQLCSKCNKYYPLDGRYFLSDSRMSYGYGRICRVCGGSMEQFTHPDTERGMLFKNGGKELLEAYNDDALIKVYESYLKGEINKLPSSYSNKESYLKIIDYLYKNKLINKHNLKTDILKDQYKLKSVSHILQMEDIYVHLYGENFYLRVYDFPNYMFKNIKLTYEIANQILKNYIEENTIDITDPLNFDYERYTKECMLTNLTNGNILYFAVQFNNFNYAGYQFKTTSSNYYKSENNILFDLRYLIENDLKLDIEKIPLYLTKSALKQKASSLHNYIVNNKNGSIYEWVNKLYPNKFIEADFEINPYRNEFDSDTERLIHDILVDKFGGNVLYNPKHTDKTIKIDGMIPDWFLHTDNGCWIIEYFGMYDVKHKLNNRISDYIEKTHRKLERYKNNVKGYKFLYLYPEDIENDFYGCREKIGKIELNS